MCIDDFGKGTEDRAGTARRRPLGVIDCRLDGVTIPSSGAAVASMNFGQERLGGAHTLEVRLDWATALTAMRPGWVELRQDAAPS